MDSSHADYIELSLQLQYIFGVPVTPVLVVLLGSTLASCLGGIPISADVIASYNAAVRVRDLAFLFGESTASLWLLAL